MARLTLTEQVQQLQKEVATLQADLAERNSIISQHQLELDAAHAAHRDLVTSIQNECDKRVKSAECAQKYYSDLHTQISNELEQAHAVLDGVDGAPSREYELEYGKGKRNVVTRLAGAFLAIAKNGGAK